MATVSLLTAEEYARLPEEQDRYSELVRGVIVPTNRTRFWQGAVTSNVAYALGRHIEQRKLGRIVTNDSGIVTERDPDTVRGADVAYFSFARLPRETEVELYPPVAPDIDVEVRSPGDRWSELHCKIAEYLAVGVTIVMVVDYEARTVSLFYNDKASLTLTESDTLKLDEVLPEFAIPVAQLFD